MFFKKDNKEKKTGFFDRLKQGLSKTRASLTGRLDRLILNTKVINEDILEELEEILYTSDLGVAAVRELIDLVRSDVARKELNDPARLKEELKVNIIKFLDNLEAKGSTPIPGQPLVIMVVGINGVGKTTTIGKLACMFRDQGKKVMLAAADTFRAAAIEQLTIWGERSGADVVKQAHGSDPSAVVFDAVNAALTRGTDIVLIDTAGRIHTKINLMDELQKIHRVTGRRLPGAPHQIWLVLDATTGQNALSQAEMFNKALGITGIILTKLDGTARGGIVVGISRQLKIPIVYIGIGEKTDDLRPFDAREFVEAIFE
ncbi:MAG: signal recognition particle-docking protein FtsY [Deltaproteobacteria bacterium]|nr:signal recognition particle-docking protein FtsY [Deltaproteobacteria bacterium]